MCKGTKEGRVAAAHVQTALDGSMVSSEQQPRKNRSQWLVSGFIVHFLDPGTGTRRSADFVAAATAAAAALSKRAG